MDGPVKIEQVLIPTQNSNVGVTEYRITIVDDQVVACTCPGFHYRGDCRHLKEVQARIDSND